MNHQTNIIKFEKKVKNSFKEEFKSEPVHNEKICKS